MRNVHWKLSDFDDKGRLRTPTALVLVLLFLSRHLLWLIMGGVSHFVGAGGGSGLPLLPPLWELPLNLPGLLLLLLVLNRERFGRRSWWRALLRRLIPVLLGLTLAQGVLLLATGYGVGRYPGGWTLLEAFLLACCAAYLIQGNKLRHFVRECAADD